MIHRKDGVRRMRERAVRRTRIREEERRKDNVGL
jgi:hypothetical protein